VAGIFDPELKISLIVLQGLDLYTQLEVLVLFPVRLHTLRQQTRDGLKLRIRCLKIPVIHVLMVDARKAKEISGCLKGLIIHIRR